MFENLDISLIFYPPSCHNAAMALLINKNSKKLGPNCRWKFYLNTIMNQAGPGMRHLCICKEVKGVCTLEAEAILTVFCDSMTVLLGTKTFD
jgi:hypothetical protein